MKTYYDLTKKERSNYKKEFKETPVGKEMHFTYYCILVLVMVFAGMWGFSSGLISAAQVVNNDFQMFNNIMGVIAIALVIIGTLWECYVEVSFTSWLKYKYDIKKFYF